MILQSTNLFRFDPFALPLSQPVCFLFLKCTVQPSMKLFVISAEQSFAAEPAFPFKGQVQYDLFNNRMSKRDIATVMPSNIF